MTPYRKSLSSAARSSAVAARRYDSLLHGSCGGAMPESRVLVAGASGQLGRMIVRKLLAAGVPVRALARRREKLLELETAGAEIAPIDLGDVRALTEACRGVGQIVATANNNMGSGPTSPTRIDLPAYQNLCASARNAKVRRLRSEERRVGKE